VNNQSLKEDGMTKPSLSQSLSQRLRHCYSSAVHDVLRELDHPNCVLPSTLLPLVPGSKLAGQVWTFSGYMDHTADRHKTLLEWTGVLAKVPHGSIPVCQPHNSEIALMGELSAQALVQREVPGYIVDGGCRDVDFLIDMNFPVFCRFNTPSDIVGRWLPDRLGEPLTIGSVTICSGDYVLADRDGIVIIAQSIAGQAIAETEKMMNTESDLRKAIINGEDPQQAYLRYGVF
jgi:regulator of RNase E activity RraA